ncbi:MAG: cellulase family glycosylhydrolase, partial [Acidobacteria bacterium]|nr:cellulase family glycosylhydrolase [Acidobacteriota bacterium]
MNTDRRISFEDRQRREHLSQEKEAPGIRRRSRSAVNAFLFSVALAAGSWATAGAVDLPPQDRHLPGLPNVDPTSDARRFEMNGRPWAPVGFYGAGMMQVNGEPSWGGNPATAFRAFIDRLEREGLNYHRTWINWGAVYVGNDPSAWDYRQVHPYQRTGPGQAADGNPKFDLTRFDQGYFDLLRDNVDYARDRGVVLQLILFDCWHLEDGNLMDRDYFHQANNVNNTGITTSAQWTDPANQAAKTHLDAFVKKIMETVGDRRNIVWETCNEVRGGSNPAVHGTIRQSIETWDPLDHLIMPGDLPEHRDV